MQNSGRYTGGAGGGAKTPHFCNYMHCHITVLSLMWYAVQVECATVKINGNCNHYLVT